MILAVDIGNTNMVFGVYGGDKLLYQFRLQSEQLKTTDEYAAVILYLLERNGIDIKDITGVIIAGVVPPLQFTIIRFVRKYIKIEPMIVGSRIKTGIPIRMENPREVGADRIVNAAGAVDKFGAPCVIIDLGTATTFDIVNSSGEYIGGIICPGVKLSAQILHSNTAKLPEISITKPSSVIGRNTIHSMQSGVYFGYVEMINGLIGRILSEEFGDFSKTALIMTGGLGGVFSKELKYKVVYEPHLTLHGLKIIYEKNFRSTPFGP